MLDKSAKLFFATVILFLGAIGILVTVHLYFAHEGTVDLIAAISGGCAVLCAVAFVFLPPRAERFTRLLIVFPAICLAWTVVHQLASLGPIEMLYRWSLGFSPPPPELAVSPDVAAEELTGRTLMNYFRLLLEAHLWTAVSVSSAWLSVSARRQRPADARGTDRRVVVGRVIALSAPIFFYAYALYVAAGEIPVGEAVRHILSSTFSDHFSSKIVLSLLLISGLLLLVLESVFKTASTAEMKAVGLCAVMGTAVSSMQFLTGAFAADVAQLGTNDFGEPILSNWWTIRGFAVTASVWTAPVFWAAVILWSGYTLYCTAIDGIKTRSWRHLAWPICALLILVGPEALLGARLVSIAGASTYRDPRCDNLDLWPKLLMRIPLDRGPHTPLSTDGLFHIEQLHFATGSSTEAFYFDDEAVRAVITADAVRVYRHNYREPVFVHPTNPLDPEVLSAQLKGLIAETEESDIPQLDFAGKKLPLIAAVVPDRSTKMKRVRQVLAAFQRAGVSHFRLVNEMFRDAPIGASSCPRLVKISIRSAF